VTEVDGATSVMERESKRARSLGVATEIAKDLTRAAEGGLGVDDPLEGSGLIEKEREGGRTGQRGERAWEAQLTSIEGELEAGEEKTTEQARQDAYGQEETGARRDPALSIEREPAAGDDAVKVRVVKEVSSPGVKDGQKADFGAEMLGIPGDRQEGL
jgi:hypothetical protein